MKEVLSKKELNYLANITASVKTKVKKEIKLRSGINVPVGTVGVVEDFRDEGRGALIKFESLDDPIKLKASSLYQRLSGFTKPPSDKIMEKWMEEGIAKTITGKRTEPDGYGPDGSPSWLLTLGYI